MKTPPDLRPIAAALHDAYLWELAAATLDTQGEHAHADDARMRAQHVRSAVLQMTRGRA